MEQPSVLEPRGVTGTTKALILHGDFVDRKVNQNTEGPTWHLLTKWPTRLQYAKYRPCVQECANFVRGIFNLVLLFLAALCAPHLDQKYSINDCNMIAMCKCHTLHCNMPDVHNSPDPLSLFGVGGAGTQDYFRTCYGQNSKEI